MFFDADDDAFICTFCSVRLSTIIKLIPSCGNSICGKCYEHLKTDVDDEGRFECQACDQTHLMHKDGLPNNLALLSLLKKEPIKRNLSHQEILLRSKVEEIQEKLSRLEAMRGAEMISLHCDQLEIEVREASESAIKHLKEIELDLLNQIKQYRGNLLAASEDFESSDSKSALRVISIEIARLCDNLTDSFSSLNGAIGDSDAKVTEEKLNNCLTRLENIEDELMTRIFQGAKLMLNANKDFFYTKNHLGSLDSFLSTSGRYMKFKKDTSLVKEPICTIKSASSEPKHAVFLPNGNLVICANQSHLIWDVEKDKEIYRIPDFDDNVKYLVLIDDNLLACASSSTIIIWDFNQRKSIRKIESGSLTCLGLGSREKKLVYLLEEKSMDRNSLGKKVQKRVLSISVCDPYTNKITQDHFEVENIYGDFYQQVTMFILPSKLVALCILAHGIKASLCITILVPSEIHLKIELPGRDFPAFAVLSDDRMAVGYKDGNLDIIDVLLDFKNKKTIKAHASDVTALLQLPDGRLLSSGCDSTRTLKLWSLEASEPKLIQTCLADYTRPIELLISSPDGTRIAGKTQYEKAIKVWRLTE